MFVCGYIYIYEFTISIDKAFFKVNQQWNYKAIKLKVYKGFTLIELVIVIAILGIIAVSATVKFVNFKSEARIASLKTASASIRDALQLFHLKTTLLGIDKQSVELTLNGVDYWNHWGYPHVKNSINDRLGIIDLSGIDQDNYKLIYEDVLHHFGTDRVKVTFEGIQDTSSCFVSVVQAADAETPPVLDQEFSGC